MMSIENLKRAHDLVGKIEATQRDIVAYREAGEISIGLAEETRIGVDRLKHQLTLSAEEIGDQIVAVLERRIAAMKTELQKLGVE